MEAELKSFITYSLSFLYLCEVDLVYGGFKPKIIHCIFVVSNEETSRVVYGLRAVFLEW